MSGSSSLFQSILTTNTVCVNNIEAMNGDDLTLQSEHKIVLDTPNLLINNLRIDKYIENYLFNETPSNQAVRHETVISTVDKIDLTNAGTTSLKMLDAMKITSLNSYTFDDFFKIDKNRQNYVNLKSSSSVNINVPVFNEITGTFSNYADNSIVYRNQGVENTLQNYIYEVVNFTTSKTRPYSPTPYYEQYTYDYDVTNMGEYFTKTIETSNVSTFNIENDDGVVRVQPGLIIESESAINIMAGGEVIINGENINDIIKASLDETYDQFQVDIMPTNGLEISFMITDFTSLYDNFVYDVKFDIVDRDSPTTIADTLTVLDILSKTFPDGPYTFSKTLTEGAFYNIVSTVTNTFTGKVITNVNMSPNASGIVAIETENFTININTTVNEANNSISFSFDQTAIQNGFDVDSDLNHDYDIVFTITQNSDPSLTFNTQTANTIQKGVTPTSPYTFINLNNGENYRITATTITNNVTSIPVQNVYITDVYLPSIPTVTLSESLTYNNTLDRRFYITITVTGDNGGFSIQGTPTLDDAVYNETVGNNVFFTFDASTLPGSKTCNIEIIDNNDIVVGGPKTATNSKIYTLYITFASVPNVINLLSTRLLNYNNGSVTTIESYVWRKNHFVIANKITHIIKVDNENATYECTISQINDQETGFRRSLSASITITLPVITNYTFNIMNLFSYTYQYTYNDYTYNYNSPYSESMITINHTSPDIHIPFLVGGPKTCRVTINDDYGFFNQFDLGTFNVIVPTSVSGITFTDIRPYSVTINWSNRGSDGNPTNTLERIKVYYNTGGYVSTSVGDYVGFKEASGINSTSVMIENLLEYTSYSIIVEKQYSESGSILTSIQTSRTAVKIEPYFNYVYATNNRIYWDINLGTANLVKIRYQIYGWDRTYTTKNHYNRSRNVYVYTHREVVDTTNIYQVLSTSIKNIGSQNIVGSQRIEEYHKEFSNASITVETDDGHSNLISGIFTIWESMNYAEGDFKHVHFFFDMQDTFINNRYDGADFYVIAHDGDHSYEIIDNNGPFFAWKYNVSSQNFRHTTDGFTPIYDPYVIDARYIQELCIKKFVGNPSGASFTNYLALKNDNGAINKYGSHGAVYFKISNYTFDSFFKKLLYNLDQYLDKKSSGYSPGNHLVWYEWYFPVLSRNFGAVNTSVDISMTHETLDTNDTVYEIVKLPESKFTRIYVYRDRITSEYKRNLPLITMWLDVESGDIPWNDGYTAPPIGPDTPEAIEIYGDSVVLSWNPNPNNHATLQSYKINMVHNDGVAEVIKIHNSVNNRYTWTGLSPNTVYRFTVTKVTDMGEFSSYPSPYFFRGTYDANNYSITNTDTQYDMLRKEYLNPSVTQAYPPSNGILEVTTKDGISAVSPIKYADPPDALTGTPSTNSISLSWNAGNHNDATFLSYTVYREEVGGAVIDSVHGITGTSYTWSNLDVVQRYHFTVVKVTDIGISGKSNQFTIRTFVYGTNPGTPTIKSRNGKSLTFKWTLGDIGTGTLVGHNLVLYNDSRGESMNSIHESTGTYFEYVDGIFTEHRTITWPEELEELTNYYFRSEMIVNYSDGYLISTMRSVSVFTFSYSRVYPDVPVMIDYHSIAYPNTNNSVHVAWNNNSHGDYTLEKVVIYRMSSDYTTGNPTWEDNLWTDPSFFKTFYNHPPDGGYRNKYVKWEDDANDFILQRIEIHANQLTTYERSLPGQEEYLYQFVFDSGAAYDTTYHFVVQKVYSDLSESQYSTLHSGPSLPVISRAFPYTTADEPFKGIWVYAMHTANPPRGITLVIGLVGLESEVIRSITFSKHPLTFASDHPYPWTEEHIVENPILPNGRTSYTFLPATYTLIDHTTYNMYATVVTNIATYMNAYAINYRSEQP